MVVFKLDRYLKQHVFQGANNNLWIKAHGDELLIVFVYVDYIMFRINKNHLVQYFGEEMKFEFEM